MNRRERKKKKDQKREWVRIQGRRREKKSEKTKGEKEVGVECGKKERRRTRKKKKRKWREWRGTEREGNKMNDEEE